MNKFHSFSVGIAIVMALSYVASGSYEMVSETTGKEPLPVVSVQLNGMNFSGPLYGNVRYSEARKKLDKKIIDDLTQPLTEMIDLIVEESGYGSLLKVSFKIYGKMDENSKALKKLRRGGDSTPLSHPDYAKKMSTLMKNIAKIKSNEKIDLKEARRRILPLLEAIQKVTEISPAGLYLNWPEFSVDGKPMIDYLAPIISSIRDNGYGAVFYVMEKVGGMIEKMSKIGRQ